MSAGGGRLKQSLKVVLDLKLSTFGVSSKDYVAVEIDGVVQNDVKKSKF